MAKQNRAYWKALLITGYKITESDYADLVDSFHSLSDDLYILEVALAQLDTDIEAANGVAKFPCPENMTIDSVFINVTTAPVGSNAIWDINVEGSTILSTKITIEAGEFSSLDATSQPVISDADVDKGEDFTIDCDQIGATTPGQNPVLVILYKKR